MKKLIIIYILILLPFNLFGRRRGLQVPLTDDTAGLWHFNTDTGDIAYDLTPNSNDGTISGTVFWIDTPLGKGLDFDADGDYVEIPYRYNTANKYTFMTWIKSTETGDSRNGVYDGSAMLYPWRFNLDGSGYITLQAGDGTNLTVVSTNKDVGWNDGKWHLLCNVYGPSEEDIKIYMDGELVGDYIRNSGGTLSSVEINYIPYHMSVNNLGSAVYGATGSSLFYTVYERILSPQEIKEIYNQQAPAFNKEPLQ